MSFAIPADHRVKLMESIKGDKYLDLAREMKKIWNMKVTVIPIVNGLNMIGTGAEEIGNKKTNGDHPNYSIVDISQTIKRSPGDLRRLAVTQTPVKNHQLMLMGKTLKREKIMISEQWKFHENHFKPMWQEINV